MDELRAQVDKMIESWLLWGYTDDRTLRLFNGLTNIRCEEKERAARTSQEKTGGNQDNPPQ